MAEKLVIERLDDVERHVGRSLGTGAWAEISQERIDAFAELTGDRQWIHVDPERARRDSPWKSTIAHGYLTLALAPALLAELVEIRGARTVVNTGIDKLRLSSAVPAGSRVRLGARIQDVRRLREGAVRVSFALRVEVEDEPKPALLATVNYAYFP